MCGFLVPFPNWSPSPRRERGCTDRAARKGRAAGTCPRRKSTHRLTRHSSGTGSRRVGPRVTRAVGMVRLLRRATTARQTRTDGSVADAVTVHHLRATLRRLRESRGPAASRMAAAAADRVRTAESGRATVAPLAPRTAPRPRILRTAIRQHIHLPNTRRTHRSTHRRRMVAVGRLARGAQARALAAAAEDSAMAAANRTAIAGPARRTHARSAVTRAIEAEEEVAMAGGMAGLLSSGTAHPRQRG